MRTYATFTGGPCYADLDIGESASPPTGAPVKLLGIGYEGPAGRPGCAELGWVTVTVGDERADIPLGWWRTVGGLRIAAELNRAYNTEPERKRWEHDYWRLEHDARLQLSDASAPLAPVGRYAFPITWGGFGGSNWLTKYSGSWGLSPTHEGVDIACPLDQGTVRAATGGRIVYVGGYNTLAEIGGPGIVVSIIGDDGLGYLYAHMSRLDPHIREGAQIAARQAIGPSGNSGFERTNVIPHLHFEMGWGESEDALLQMLRPPWCDVTYRTLAFRVNPLPYLYQWFQEYLSWEDEVMG